MELDELLNTGIGDKEAPRLGPAKVTILGVTIKRKNKKDEVMETPLVTFLCKHPDSEEPIQINKVKIEEDGNLKVIGMWANVDEDKKILKGSSLAKVLSFIGCKTLKEVDGKTMEAIDESKDSKYLCLKAY
ncbi:hypothetical protein LCGC14_3143610 [marine sediment metagenome]|uniref:Uncharacterized protein n=1 Tax=marine sediment metagenome TaxID=412755 RepID=A0A0F8WK37_9ZZZZ